MERQQAADTRRIRRASMTGIRERLVSGSAPSEHELFTATQAAVIDQRIADSTATDSTDLRRRQIELLRLQAS
jgi:hypothetical protein